MTCEHDYVERINADSDGYCCLCQKAEIERLRAALKEISEQPGFYDPETYAMREIARNALAVYEQQTRDLTPDEDAKMRAALRASSEQSAPKKDIPPGCYECPGCSGAGCAMCGGAGWIENT